ncbi:MAG: hypothetical protein ACOYOP_12430 [Microthrixaceae bacterium]
MTAPFEAVARGDARFPPASGPDMTGNPLDPVARVGPGGMLDGAFSLLRFRAGRLVGLTAVLFLPVQLVGLAVALASPSIAASSAGDPFGLGAVGAASSADGLWGYPLIFLRSLALGLLGAGVGHLVACWWAGRDARFGEVAGQLLRRSPAVLVVVVLSAAMKVPLLCLGGIGWFLADGVLFISNVVVGAERCGPLRALRRSLELVRPAYGPALVVVVGGLVITQVLQIALVAGPVLLVASFQPPEGWLLAVEQVTSLVLLIAMPLTACIAGRAYVELRCRVEGIDLIRWQERRGLV